MSVNTLQFKLGNYLHNNLNDFKLSFMGTCSSRELDVDFRTNLKKLPLDIPVPEKILSRRRGGVAPVADLDSIIKESQEAFDQTCLSLENIELKIQEFEHKAANFPSIDTWSLDIFEFDKASDYQPICCMGIYLFSLHGLIKEFDLDRSKVAFFLYEVQRNYWNNLYHNAIHAADVAQAMHVILKNCIAVDACLTKADYMACIIAALCHDLNHPGVNQSFLVNTEHVLSKHFAQSPLENYHAIRAYKIINDCGLLDPLEPEVKEYVLNTINKLILATDMGQHAKYMEKFKECISSGLDLRDEKHKMLTLCIAIKCADISNGCRPWNVCNQWANKIIEEFFRQGDVEKDMSLVVSFLCDRETIKIPESQTNFINFVLLPLYTLWHEATQCAAIHTAISNLKHNHDQWKSK